MISQNYNGFEIYFCLNNAFLFNQLETDSYVVNILHGNVCEILLSFNLTQR